MNCRASSELCREAAVCRAGRNQQLKQVEPRAWACGFMIHDYSFHSHRAAHISEQSEIGDSLDFVEHPQKCAGKREPRPHDWREVKLDPRPKGRALFTTF